jgi:hypothetical protein
MLSIPSACSARVAALAAVLASIGLAPAASAQAPKYPEKAVQYLIPFPAGGESPRASSSRRSRRSTSRRWSW